MRTKRKKDRETTTVNWGLTVGRRETVLLYMLGRWAAPLTYIVVYYIIYYSLVTTTTTTTTSQTKHAQEKKKKKKKIKNRSSISMKFNLKTVSYRAPSHGKHSRERTRYAARSVPDNCWRNVAEKRLIHEHVSSLNSERSKTFNTRICLFT